MHGDIIIEGEGIKVQIREARMYWDKSDSRNRRQVIYQETHVYVGIESEGLLDNLRNRHQRPYTIWKKELLPVVARMIERETGLVMEGGYSWDRKLGCSCPCSPGFRTSMRDGNGNTKAYTVWVTI